MRNGELYPQKTPSGLAELRAYITSGKESGLSQQFPTPNCIGYRSDGELRILARTMDRDELRQICDRAAQSKIDKALSEKVPTPRSADGQHGGVTPTDTTARRVANGKANLSEYIREQTRKVPTPTATSWKGWSPGHNRANSDDRLDYTIEREASQAGTGGRLNPTWEEWLMGWPIGWTELKPSATGRFQQWCDSHGISCETVE
jgi:hypothetical protein